MADAQRGRRVDHEIPMSPIRPRPRKTGHPLVLTINGKAEPVVQDAEAYQALLDRVETIEGIQRGLSNVEARRVKPARRVFDRLRRSMRFRVEVARAGRDPIIFKRDRFDGRSSTVRKPPAFRHQARGIPARIVEIRKPYRCGQVGWRWLELAAVGWPEGQNRGQSVKTSRSAETRETWNSFDQLDLSPCGEVAEWLKAAVC